jgi:hypothetical protein
MAGLKVKIGADASQFERTMRGVTRQVKGVKSSILGIAGATGAILAVNKAFDGMRIAARGAFDFIKSASDEAASIENLTMQFETLLRSTEKGKKRIEEIVDFAASTPFQIKGLAETSAMLQGMTQGALATGSGLRLVGDAAAAVNKPLETVGMNIGKIYQAITEGGDLGDATNQLMQYGLVTGKAKIELQEFVKAAKAGDKAFMSEAQALAKLSEMFAVTEGAMERLAQTTDGKKSMVKDAMDQIKVAFGTGFNEGLRDALDAATEFIPQFKDKMAEAGDVIGTAISEAVQGNFSMFEAMGRMIIDSIGLGMTQSLRILERNFYAGLEELNPLRKIPFSRHKDAQRGSEIVEQHRVRELEEARLRMGQQMNALRTMNYMASDQTFQSGGQTFRYQSPTATTQSPFVDAQGKRIVQVLERIDSKMTPDFAN